MRVLFISFFLVCSDQISKFMVKGFSIPFLRMHYEGMFHGQRIRVLGDFFQITFIENPGMAFGYDPGSSFKFYVSLFSLVASIALIVYLYIARKQSLSLRISLAFILGGAVGNLIDRMFYGVFYGYAPLFYGRVVDFLDFDFIHFTFFGRTFERFPVFNIADASVTIGVLILIIFYKHHQMETETALSGNTTDLITGSINLNQGTINDEPDKGKDIPL
ncbi:MAG: signal peptidase II [Ignavibacteriaceae bacterium]|nr:signal peptidase II [Ignavibacteriaceae bacterium]